MESAEDETMESGGSEDKDEEDAAAEESDFADDPFGRSFLEVRSDLFRDPYWRKTNLRCCVKGSRLRLDAFEIDVHVRAHTLAALVAFLVRCARIPPRRLALFDADLGELPADFRFETNEGSLARSYRLRLAIRRDPPLRRDAGAPGAAGSPLVDGLVDAALAHTLAFAAPAAVARLAATSARARAKVAEGLAAAAVAAVFARSHRAVGLAAPALLAPSSLARRLGAWTEWQSCDVLEPVLALAFSRGAVADGLGDAAFAPRDAAVAAARATRAAALVDRVAWVECARRLDFQDTDARGDVVHVAHNQGDPWPSGRVDMTVQSIVARANVGARVAVRLKATCHIYAGGGFGFGIHGGLSASVDGAAEVDLATYAADYGDAAYDPNKRAVQVEACAAVSAALGLPGDARALLGFLWCVAAGPFRWAQPVHTYVNPRNLALLVRRQLVLATTRPALGASTTNADDEDHIVEGFDRTGPPRAFNANLDHEVGPVESGWWSKYAEA